jgi:hypothetical protein
VLVRSAAVFALERITATGPISDHETLDVDRLSIDDVIITTGVARSLAGLNRHVRGQWLRAAQSIR